MLNYGVGGSSVAGMNAALPAWLLDFQRAFGADAPVRVLLNIGANDIAGGTSQAAFEASSLSALDKINAALPNATVYMAKPWWGSYGDAAANQMAGWIDNVVAARLFVVNGHDERVWLKGSDNGATMTTDSAHYSAAGQTECKNQWLTILP